jgi:hypothetical protein
VLGIRAVGLWGCGVYNVLQMGCAVVCILDPYQSTGVHKMKNTEYIVWGKTQNNKYEDVMYTQAQTMQEAERVCKLLEAEYSVSETRIQILQIYDGTEVAKMFANSINF